MAEIDPAELIADLSAESSDADLDRAWRKILKDAKPDRAAIERLKDAMAEHGVKKRVAGASLKRVEGGLKSERRATAIQKTAESIKKAIAKGERPVIDRRTMGHEPSLAALRSAITAANDKAIAAGDSTATVLYSFAGSPAIVRDVDGRVFTRALDFATLKPVLKEFVEFAKVDDFGDSYSEPPPDDLTSDILASFKNEFPGLRGVVTMPFFTMDGARPVLVSTPGYDATSGYWLAPPAGFELPEIPDKITPTHVEAAKANLAKIFGEFPYRDNTGHRTDTASYTHVVAAQLSFFCRDLIKGSVPICFVSKPQPATGATKLLSSLIRVGTGLPAKGSSEIVGSEEEIRKTLFSVALAGAPYYWLDNVTRKLASPTLANVLTQEVISERVLGGNRMADAAVRMIPFVSGNNAAVSEELARRSYLVRLDAAMTPAELRRREFAVDLDTEVPTNLALYVWSCLVLVKNWIDGGGYEWSGRPLASFEAWSRVIGGILEDAGYEHFLANAEMLDDLVSADDPVAALLMAMASDPKAREPRTLRQMDPCRAIDDLDLAFGDFFDSRDDDAKEKWLARKFPAYRDVVLASGDILRAGVRDHQAIYWFEHGARCYGRGDMLTVDAEIFKAFGTASGLPSNASVRVEYQAFMDTVLDAPGSHGKAFTIDEKGVVRLIATGGG